MYNTKTEKRSSWLGPFFHSLCFVVESKGKSEQELLLILVPSCSGLQKDLENYKFVLEGVTRRGGGILAAAACQACYRQPEHMSATRVAYATLHRGSKSSVALSVPVWRSKSIAPQNNKIWDITGYVSWKYSHHVLHRVTILLASSLYTVKPLQEYPHRIDLPSVGRISY